MSIDGRLVRAFHAAWGTALGNFVWYALFAGIAWAVFSFLFARLAPSRKIVPRKPAWSQLGWEIFYSLRSLLIFGLVGGAVVYAILSGMPIKVYRRIDDHSWVWYVASVVIAILIHDTYFYWTHRLMHHPLLFRLVHRTHHLSNNPTPWAAYSFGVGEAFVQAGIGPLLLFTVPMHYSAFLAFMLWQLAFNVLGHCGFEFFPSWFFRTPLGHLLNTPTHHAMHHEKIAANFSLYFNVWDRLMGTNHHEYEKRFEQVTTRPAASPRTGEKPPFSDAEAPSG